MKSERSMGIFIFVCSLFCLVYAADRYYSAVKTAEAVSEAIAERVPGGFELESVGIPAVTILGGAVGVMLLVAGLILIVKSFKQVESDNLIETDS